MLLTVIGDLVEDIVVWTSATTRPGTDNPAEIRRSRGGSGATVAAAAAAAGASARFIGRVGDDRLGDHLERELLRAGVDARLQRGGRTGCVVVIVGVGGERTMFPDRAAAADLGPIVDDDLAATTVLHLPLYGFLDPASAAHLHDAAERVRARGGAVTIDLSASSAVEQIGVGAVRTLVDELAPAVVFANADEAATAGLASMEPAGCFVVKDGPRPATIVQQGGRRTTVAPAPIDGARDTTGAGDVFAGTFLARWSAGVAPEAACAEAHRAAARTLGLAGATTAAPW